MLASPAYQSRPVSLSWLESWHGLSPTPSVCIPQNSSAKLSASYHKKRLRRQFSPLLILGKDVDLAQVVAVLTIHTCASQSTLDSCEHICSSENQILREQVVRESQMDDFCSSPALVNGTRPQKLLNKKDETSETFPLLSVDRECSEAAEVGEKDAHLIEMEKVRRRKISQANKGQIPWNKCKNNIRGVSGLENAADTYTTKQMSRVCCSTKGDGDDVTMLIKEKLRRQRISHANRGKVPWNKGRQHSEETKQRIRERTFEAMKDSKVREKLRVHGESLSPETRLKIKESMTQLWIAKKELNRLQNYLLGEWEEAIAESAKIGGDGDIAYQWNSYASELVALKDAWRRERKKMRVKAGLTRISLRHRANISKAIKAKWADPSYRMTVERGMIAFWQKRVEGKMAAEEIASAKMSNEVKEVESDELQPQAAAKHESDTFDDLQPQAAGKRESDTFADLQPQAAVKRESDTVADLQPQAAVKRESDTFDDLQPQISVKCLPAYSNPLSDTRLEKLKQMRASRLLDRLKQRAATDRARLLMEEAQKAARALEAAAAKDSKALVSLLEAQKLLAEAAHSFDLAQMHTQPSVRTARH